MISGDYCEINITFLKSNTDKVDAWADDWECWNERELEDEGEAVTGCGEISHFFGYCHEEMLVEDLPKGFTYMGALDDGRDGLRRIFCDGGDPHILDMELKVNVLKRDGKWVMCEIDLERITKLEERYLDVVRSFY